MRSALLAGCYPATPHQGLTAPGPRFVPALRAMPLPLKDKRLGALLPGAFILRLRLQNGWWRWRGVGIDGGCYRDLGLAFGGGIEVLDDLAAEGEQER